MTAGGKRSGNRPAPGTLNGTFVGGRTRASVSHPGGLYRATGLDRWILNVTESGYGLVNSRQPAFTEFQVQRGDLMLFPPTVVHDYGVHPLADEWVHLWVYFSPGTRIVPLLNWPEDDSGVLRLHVDDNELLGTICDRMQGIVNFTHSGMRQRMELAVNYLEEILLWCDLHNPRSGPLPDIRIRKALDYIDRNYVKKLDVPAIAAQCTLSTSRFGHLFTETVGLSPIRYIEQRRIEKACQLLLGTTQPLGEIAEAVGYDDQLYFSKVFKKVTGQSPSTYRRAH